MIECVFIGYCNNGRIKTLWATVNNSRDASGRVEWRKKPFTVMASPTCIFFLPLTIMWRCLFGRKAESRRGRFSLSAGCLSACGEEEADKWMGAAKEWERGRADLSVICLRFKSKLLTDERRRCLSGSSPAHKTSV